MLLASPHDMSSSELVFPIDVDSGTSFSAPAPAESTPASVTVIRSRPSELALHWVRLYRKMVQAEATSDGSIRLSFPVMYYRSIQAGQTNDGGSNLPFGLPWIDEKNIIVDLHRAPIRYRTQDTVVQAGIATSYRTDLLLVCPKCSVNIPHTDDARDSPCLEAIHWIKRHTRLSQQRIAALFGVGRQTLYLWENGGSVSDANRRRILAVRDVLERASRRYTLPDHLLGWLDTPRSGDAQTPAELLEGGEIDRARYLAVATAADKARPSPAWARKSVNEAFRGMRERKQGAFPLTKNATDQATEVGDDEPRV